MKYAVVLCAILMAMSAAYTEEDDVLVLTTDTFQQAIDEFKFILVEFYAPWCGHCKKLAPEFSGAAKELKQAGDSYVPLAKVDATVESSIGEKYKVEGYPTLKFFIAGQPIDYEGGRTHSEIVAWISKKTGPPSVEVSGQGLQDFIDRSASGPVVVFFGSEDDNDFQTYKAVAQKNEKVLFAHTFDIAAKEQHSVSEKVVLFKNFDEKRNELNGAITEATLEAFLKQYSVPTILPFNDKAIGVIFQEKNNAIFLFTDDTEQGKAAYEAFVSVAGPYTDKIKFSFSKQNDGFGLFGRLAEYIGASQTQIPNIMLYDQTGTNGKFKYEGEITADGITQFLDGFFAGTLKRYMKSDPIPETNDEPVKVLVGLNYQDLVLNNDKDVLVEFYAPWCGHCKTLAPIYEEVARKLQVNSNIILVKCDATANEIDGVNVESFPTIKFWKNGAKDAPAAYNGGRDEAGILQWLKENTSHPWVDLDRAEEL